MPRARPTPSTPVTSIHTVTCPSPGIARVGPERRSRASRTASRRRRRGRGSGTSTPCTSRRPGRAVPNTTYRRAARGGGPSSSWKGREHEPAPPPLRSSRSEATRRPRERTPTAVARVVEAGRDVPLSDVRPAAGGEASQRRGMSRPAEATNARGTTKGRPRRDGLCHIKPAATYSPRPLRAKYHRR